MLASTEVETTMKLYFLRHGQAVDRGAWLGLDADRPLTDEGTRIVGEVGKSMARLGMALGQVVSSNYLRAQQTAQIVGRKLGLEVRIDPRLAPGFDIARLTRLLDERGGEEDLLLVGHEPDFSETISALVGGGRLRCKKAGLVRIDLDAGRPREAEIAWILPPKLLLKL